MYDGRTKLADQVADEVRNHFGDLVLKAVIPRNVRVSEAPGYGQSVLRTTRVRGGAELLRGRAGAGAARRGDGSAEPDRRPGSGGAPVAALAREDGRAQAQGSTRTQAASDRDRSRGELMSKRGGLGRGLAALIPTAPATPAPAPAADRPPLDRTPAAWRRTAGDVGRGGGPLRGLRCPRSRSCRRRRRCSAPPWRPWSRRPAAFPAPAAGGAVDDASQRQAAAAGVRRRGAGGADPSVKEFGLLQPIVVRERARRRVRADDG